LPGPRSRALNVALRNPHERVLGRDGPPAVELSPRHGSTLSGSTSLSDALARVLRTVLSRSAGSSDAHSYARAFGWPRSPRFLPAGRTLGTADPATRTIVPNCTVASLGESSRSFADDLALRAAVLDRTTGIGGSLDALPRDISGAELTTVLDMLGAQPPRDVTGRRPGLLLTMSADHPGVGDFLRYKASHWDALRDRVRSGTLAGRAGLDAPAAQMNVSVSVTGPLGDGDHQEIVLRAAAAAAHACGDPGLLFPDAVPLEPVMHDDDNNSDSSGHRWRRARATSPCGELWLQDGEFCNLGNLVLHAFHDPDAPVGADGIDWRALGVATRAAVSFLDRVTDCFPAACGPATPGFYRRIGLGVMGWATLLARLGIPYSSAEARDLARRLGEFIYREAAGESARLAECRGTFLPPLPLLTGSGATAERRNVTVLALAPTGGTSTLIPGTTPSIEPAFSEAHAILPDDHLGMVAAWQEWSDNGVSKTVNLPADASVDDVVAVFKAAHGLGLRGVTVFRDTSLENTGTRAPVSCAMGGGACG
jgi:hypothetical protein